MRRPTGEEPSSPLRGTPFLDRIPLALRVAFYYSAFLAFVLIALPYLAHRGGILLFGSSPDLGPFRVGGWVLFALGLACYTGSTIVLTSRGRGAYVEFDPPKEFVAQGPYRWCRNPIAASLIVAVLGLGIALSSIGILVLVGVCLPLAHAQVVLLEEPLLRKRFGSAYEDYLLTVPRWIPKPPARPGA